MSKEKTLVDVRLCSTL